MPVALLLWLAFAGKPDSALNAQIEQIARTVSGRVGVSAEVIETGQSASFHGGDRFPMESVCKLPIAMAVLNELDRGNLRPEEKIRVLPADLAPPLVHSPLRDRHPNGAEMSMRDLLEYTIQQSDGTASDVLLRLAGGPRRVTAFAQGLGAKNLSIEATENEMGHNESAGYHNWATPESAVALLRALQGGHLLSAARRDYLLKLMSTGSTSTHRIQGLLPQGTSVAHKTGTSDTSHGVTRGTNDIGLVTLPDGRHLAIAVFIADSHADEAARESVIAKIARAIWDRWLTAAPPA